jgi:rhodanese-related sulfurtransferase
MENSVTAADLATLTASGRPFTLLDVRRKEDRDASPETADGAQWKDPAKIDQWQAAIPREQEVVVFCVRGGSVSQGVRQRLADAGVQARYVAGGLEALVKRPRP